ncbi:MAG: hypothetical protein QW331_01785 [Candidatus Woesearchaeota archaeon]
MAIVIITPTLFKEIEKKFNNKEANEIIDLLETLEDNPKKGREVCNVGNIIIKEIRYDKFRFYFVTDGFKVRFLKIEELKNLIIKFVRMSDKKDQQKTIEEIKHVLRNLGEERF